MYAGWSDGRRTAECFHLMLLNSKLVQSKFLKVNFCFFRHFVHVLSGEALKE